MRQRRVVTCSKYVHMLRIQQWELHISSTFPLSVPVALKIVQSGALRNSVHTMVVHYSYCCTHRGARIPLFCCCFSVYAADVWCPLRTLRAYVPIQTN